MTRAIDFVKRSPRLATVGLALVALLVVVLAYPVVVSAHHMSYASLGRDTGIYQYVAWALGKGARPYVDIRENNGPLVYAVHALFLALGGGDEHVFRTLDIVTQVFAYALAGVVAYGPWTRREPDTRRDALVGRSVFGALGVCVLLCQYFLFDWWATAQRESTYDAILIVGLSLQLRAHQIAAVDGVRVRAFTAFVAASGAVVAATWFGKPTYVACSAAQLGCLLFDRATRAASWRGVVALAGGSLATACVFLGWVALRGNVVDYVRVVLIEPTIHYVPIWKQTLALCYTLGHNAPLVNRGAITLALLVLLLAFRVVPRSFAVVLWPVTFGLLSFFAQRKGFFYHLHPVTSGAYWAWVVLLGWAVDRTKTERPLSVVFAYAAVMGLAASQCIGDATMTDWYRGPWMPEATRPETRETRSFYANFETRDFDGYEIRRAASFLSEHVPPDGTVQTYGLEPYVLFLAQRLSATPFLYLYDLNMDPALEGGPGGKPNAKEAARIHALQSRNAKDLYDGLVARPPSAFLLIDEAPMAYAPDAHVDFRVHCPDAAAFLDANYTEAARFGKLRVFLPKEKVAAR